MTKENLDKIQEEEQKFWKEYADLMSIKKYRDAYIYSPLYQDELKKIKEFLNFNNKEKEKWLDLGCGSLPVTELILEESRGNIELWGGDINLEPAKKRLEELSNSPIKLEYIDLTRKLPFPDNFFDGIVSSKVLPYISNFEGAEGKEAIKKVFREIYRILKPKGVLIWTYNTKDSNNLHGIIVSIGYLLNPYEWIKRKVFLPFYAIKMMGFFKGTIEKLKKGIYHSFSKEEYEDLLTSVGFRNLEWKSGFGDMVLINKAEK